MASHAQFTGQDRIAAGAARSARGATPEACGIRDSALDVLPMAAGVSGSGR